MKNLFARHNLPFLTTLGVFLLLYVVCIGRYDNFGTLRVFLNLFNDNAYLGIAALGMTFVILSGGIDLSVGSVIGCTTILLATLIEKGSVHPYIALLMVLAFGALFGLGQGVLVSKFDLPPFLVTLGGLFFARGAALWISQQQIAIDHPAMLGIGELAIKLDKGARIQVYVIVFVLLILFFAYLLKYTSFGRSIYAVGGNESSANLMGVPVKRTKTLVYVISSVCAVLAGITYVIYSPGGNALAGETRELDTIAAVVIGGTLLRGGVGNVFGSVIGILIFGLIATAINFEGTLSPWWAKIAIGLLVLVFIVLQRFLVPKQATPAH